MACVPYIVFTYNMVKPCSGTNLYIFVFCLVQPRIKIRIKYMLVTHFRFKSTRSFCLNPQPNSRTYVRKYIL